MNIALERLSKINDEESFKNWYSIMTQYGRISDIQEVVALAKSKQQPSIDTMRFEAAKAAMSSLIVNNSDLLEDELIECAFVYADKLISELKKQSHDNTPT